MFMTHFLYLYLHFYLSHLPHLELWQMDISPGLEVTKHPDWDCDNGQGSTAEAMTTVQPGPNSITLIPTTMPAYHTRMVWQVSAIPLPVSA